MRKRKKRRLPPTSSRCHPRSRVCIYLTKFAVNNGFYSDDPRLAKFDTHTQKVQKLLPINQYVYYYLALKHEQTQHTHNASSPFFALSDDEWRALLLSAAQMFKASFADECIHGGASDTRRRISFGSVDKFVADLTPLIMIR